MGIKKATRTCVRVAGGYKGKKDYLFTMISAPSA